MIFGNLKRKLGIDRERESNVGIGGSAKEHAHLDSTYAISKDQRPSTTKVINWNLALAEVKVGEIIKEFDAGEEIQMPIKWQFFLAPSKLNSKQYLGLFLRTAPVTGNQEEALHKLKHLYAMFEAQLLEPLPVLKIRQPKEWDYKQGNWGVVNFIDMCDFQRMKENGQQLKLQLTLIMFGPTLSASTTTENAIVEPLLKKQKMLMNMAFEKSIEDIIGTIRSMEYTDMVLKSSDNREIPVHRIVLAARSKYFKNAIFQNGSFITELKLNYPFEIMKTIICHLYNGQLHSELVDPTERDMAFAEELVEAASLYDMADLKEYMIQFYPGLQKKINEKMENRLLK